MTLSTFTTTELPIRRCGHCGRRFECGLLPFCSFKCQRAHGAWLDANPRKTTADRRAEMVRRVDAAAAKREAKRMVAIRVYAAGLLQAETELPGRLVEMGAGE